MCGNEGVDDVAVEGPIIAHVISDSFGDTACGVVRAAAARLDQGAIIVSCLSHVETRRQVARYLDLHHEEGMPTAVFYTILDEGLCDDIRQELDGRGIPSLDLLGPTLRIFSTLLNTNLHSNSRPLVDGTGATVHYVDARLLSERRPD